MARVVDAQSTNLGMGTVMTHRAFGKHSEESLRAVGDEAVRLEEMLSRFMPRSEISRINRFLKILPRLLRCHRWAFSLSIGSLRKGCRTSKKWSVR